MKPTKMKHVFLALGLLMITVFGACAKGGKRKDAAIRTLTSADNNKTVTLKKGAAFKVVFKEECIGCAKIWEITGQDKQKIALLREANANPSCTNCEGGSQDHIFYFKVKDTGQSTLSFQYFEDVYAVKLSAK